MNALISLHNAIFDRFERLEPVLLPTLARLIFAGVLLVFFWKSALTKLTGPFSLDTGAFIQIFPRKFEALGYDPSGFGALDRLIVYAGSYGELILPLLIVIGLFTRIAALGMVVFVGVMTYVDIYAAKHAAWGQWFDNIAEFDPALKAIGLADSRFWWVFLLLYLVMRGAGALSVDRFLFGPRDESEAA